MRALLAVAVSVLVVAACGGSRAGDPVTLGPGSTRPAAEPGTGSLIIARFGSIVERDLQSGDEVPLFETTAANSFVLDPAVSPDAATIAFINMPPAQIEEGRFDAGSDLWVMSRDGSNPRLLWEHADPNQLVRFPRWESAASILAIVQEISTQDGITRVVYTLQRFDVATGERETVLEDVLAFDVSPDGQRLVYASLLPQTGEVLAGSDVAGGDLAELVGADQFLAPFAYPRFSPDGATIAFAAADQTGALGPGVRFVSLFRGQSGRFEPHSAVSLDGLPQDIWTVEAAGGTAVRIADLKEDLPSLTWDGSGERIYVLGVSGLYDVNLRSGAVGVIGEGAYHAQLAWVP